MRRRLTIVITFLAGLYFFLEFVLPESISYGPGEEDTFVFGRYDEQISIGFQTVGVMAFALGAISILKAHGSIIGRMRKGWGVSIALILSLFASAFIGAAIWHARSVSSHMAREVSNMASVQQLIISSADTPPIPPYMKNWDPEDIPPEINRTATIAERAAAQEKLVARLEAFQSTLETQPRPEWDSDEDPHPTDELVATMETVVSAATSGRNELHIGDAEAAAPHLAAADTNLQKAAGLQRSIANLILEQSTANKTYDLLFKGLFTALGSAMFSLLAFYIATAAYRAFRIQSGEAVMLMVAALLVMLGQIPLGVALMDFVLQHTGIVALAGWCGIDELSITQVRLWILRTINTAAFRGIYIGSAIAGLSMAWRVWWSMESGALIDDVDGSDEGESSGSPESGGAV